MCSLLIKIPTSLNTEVFIPLFVLTNLVQKAQLKQYFERYWTEFQLYKQCRFKCIITVIAA